MKKLCAAVVIFAVGIVFTAVWFSPLRALGKPQAYADNAFENALDGLCYPYDAVARVDLSGDENDMFDALERIFARTVKRVRNDGLLVVYAYSPRVCAKSQTTSDGKTYNVMAAYSDGKICIGTPILSGCY